VPGLGVDTRESSIPVLAEEPANAPLCTDWHTFSDSPIGSSVSKLRERVLGYVRKGTCLVSATAVLVVGMAMPIIDSMAVSSEHPHFELPGGPAYEHPDHNHAFCAILGATPVLPGSSPRPAVCTGAESVTAPLAAIAPPTVVSRITRHSRAPPAREGRA
jgi:hypothetical protein